MESEDFQPMTDIPTSTENQQNVPLNGNIPNSINTTEGQVPSDENNCKYPFKPNNKYNSPLSFQQIKKCSHSKARVSKLYLPHCGPHDENGTIPKEMKAIETPIFMPVGTQGTIKGLLSHQVEFNTCPIILANTYHLGQRPGVDILEKAGGLHKFMNRKGPMLTDSGGFQMVSLLKLAQITEQGVQFESPHDGSTMMLTPEESMKIQNAIGADIMMALDDVIATTTTGPRVEEAMHRTIRWIDRCIAAHKRPHEQNLFGIVQGGLDTNLRKKCLEELIKRDLPGYAIGGLSGGEDKIQFQEIVNLCTDYLPENKPRYCMGVGYPEDLVVCVALGVDMFDCVYPCRTARFGTALTSSGTMKVKNSQFEKDLDPIDENLNSWTGEYSRAYFNRVASRESSGCNLTTQHNIHFMMQLMSEIREAIRNDQYPEYVRAFMKRNYPDGKYPNWIVVALKSVNIELE